MRAGTSSALVILVETSIDENSDGERMEGTSSDDGLGIMHTLRDLVLFISCYLALNLQNDLVVLALHNGDCHYLYESPKSKLRRGVRVQPPVSDVCKVGWQYDNSHLSRIAISQHHSRRSGSNPWIWSMKLLR